MQSSQQKTALVTGGNKGIGFAICNGLLDAGFDVILAARAVNKAEAAADQLGMTSPLTALAMVLCG